MPFGLKNAVATFQRMVNKVFKDLIRNTMEVYMDDMLVKSIHRTDHLQTSRQNLTISLGNMR